MWQRGNGCAEDAIKANMQKKTNKKNGGIVVAEKTDVKCENECKAEAKAGGWKLEAG